MRGHWTVLGLPVIATVARLLSVSYRFSCIRGLTLMQENL